MEEKGLSKDEWKKELALEKLDFDFCTFHFALSAQETTDF